MVRYKKKTIEKKEMKGDMSKKGTIYVREMGRYKKNKISYSKNRKCKSGVGIEENEALRLVKKIRKYANEEGKIKIRNKSTSEKCNIRPYRKYKTEYRKRGRVAVYEQQHKQQQSERTDKQYGRVHSQCGRAPVRATRRIVRTQKRDTSRYSLTYKELLTVKDGNMCRKNIKGKKCKNGIAFSDTSDHNMSGPSPMDLDNIDSFPVLGLKKGNGCFTTLSEGYVINEKVCMSMSNRHRE
jgi:hypothetical protein